MAAWNDILKAKLETLLGERGTGKDAALRRGEVDAILNKAATLAAEKVAKASGAGSVAAQALSTAKAAQAAAKQAQDTADALQSSLQEAGDAVTVGADAFTLANFISNTSTNLRGQASAISTITGNLSATYAFRAQAGSAGALLELVASSDPAGSVSIARIHADNILLDGSVSMRKLFVGDTSNIVPDAEMRDTESWERNASWWARVINPVSTGFSAAGAWRFDKVDATAGYVSLIGLRFPVESSGKYYFRYQTWAASGVGYRVWGRINWHDSNGDSLGTYATIDNSAVSGGTQFSREAIITVPSNAKFGRLAFYALREACTGSFLVSAAVGRRALTGELVVDGEIKAGHVDTASFGASGLALFGGELRSTNFVQGSTGWRIKNDGTTELESLIVRTRHLEDNAVTTLRTATGASTVVSNDFLTTVASLTFTPFGTNMVVWLRFTANLNAPTSGTNSLLYQLRWRGVNQISDWVFNVPVGSSLSETVSDMWLIQVPGNTSGTLLLQARTGNSAGGTVSNGLLVVGEFKK